MKSLTDKIDKVKDEHAAEQLQNLQNHHEEKALSESFFILGRIKQNDHLAGAIASNLYAQSIRALERFQQEKRHEVLGYKQFDRFLDESDYSPLSKRQYYDRLALVRQHGDEIYDLLTSIGISVRSQKLLGKGDIAIKGDRLVAGDTEIELKDTGVIKDLLNDLFEEKRSLAADNEKLERTVEKQKDQIRRGSEENEELRRNLDEIDETTRFERALMNAVNGMLLLAEAIGELDEDEKKIRGPQDLKLFAQQYFKLSDAYGVKRSLTEAVPAGDSIVDKAIAEMAEDGSFEDLD